MAVILSWTLFTFKYLADIQASPFGNLKEETKANKLETHNQKKYFEDYMEYYNENLLIIVMKNIAYNHNWNIRM